MEILKLWQGIKTSKCETCKNEDCRGRLVYDNLCSNVNYLKEYGERNYEKNRDTFMELKKVMGQEKPYIFSFGCGIGLDYLGAVDAFGEKVVYYPIDECNWAIKDTDNFKNFEPQLPKKAMKLNEALSLLTMMPKTATLCFFNSLFIISDKVEDFKPKLVRALKNKSSFHFVCDYTINSNYHLASTEQEFIVELLKELKDFSFKKIDILDGKGIIIVGKKK